ncbi:MAG: nucleotidyl transferase AbiEii/AbiGii toxin family protein [Filifactor alocis]|jgi:putative abortive infection protein|uniref:nucleotidyl transferase AbiEii/AbiGii toxin family protein n=1 Tax=Filifactor alocis TaxID=143361 RepID=UPI003FA13B26
MNKAKLRAICQKLSKETGLSFNAIQTHYFLESILEKIADSDENENFIFKGGFLLANVIGIRQRSTVDIDFLIRRFSLTEENIGQRFEKILQSGNNNGITYEIQKIEEIRKEDEYGGFRITVLCRLENIRQTIPLDIATGDPITPSEISYEYKSIFNDQFFEICAYNIETMLAEKIQTIYQRGIFNSRSKDFYDIYILYHLKKDEIDFESLKKACQNTFRHRSTDFSLDSILNTLNSLKAERNLEIRWSSYQKRFAYAEEISFDNVIDTAIELVQNIR